MIEHEDIAGVHCAPAYFLSIYKVHPIVKREKILEISLASSGSIYCHNNGFKLLNSIY